MLSTSNSERMCAQLRITLKSDLCVATGDGFSSGIDTDVCFDDAGLPVIPARRLKGCLREAAVMLFEEGNVVNALFGVSGADQSNSLLVSDAVLLSPTGGMFASGRINSQERQKVVDLFTYTRAQTAMEDGRVKDGSLRYIRVVRHYYPKEASEAYAEMVFEATIDFDGALEDELKETCLALRNIGMNRNRGFGAVRCELEDIAAGANTVSAPYRKTKHDGYISVEYAVRLDSPLMLPQQNGDESIDYIPGTSVLGFFASRLKNSDMFNDLFLSDTVHYSPLYPVDSCGKRCMPASPIVVKLKGGDRDGEYCSADAIPASMGIMPKPLKTGFIGADYMPVEVETEIVYHHRTGADATLYTQQCLSAGQVFSGFIEAPSDRSDLIEAICGVLDGGQLSFGRSKTAQYSRCSLVDLVGDNDARRSLRIEKGKRYAFVLDSDVALISNNACYTTDFQTLMGELREAVGPYPWFEAPDVATQDRAISYLSCRTISGYNAKWNQKKPHIRALAAGSCVVVRATSSVSDQAAEFLIGVKRAEGLGRVRIVPVEDVVPSNAKLARDNSCAGGALGDLVAEMDMRERARLATVQFARRRKGKFGVAKSFNPSFVGRLGRMAEQSENREDFDNRVNSIKTDSKKLEAEKLVKSFRAEFEADGLNWAVEQECLVLLFTLGKYFVKQNSGDCEETNR